jgi:PKD repeat protein
MERTEMNLKRTASIIFFSIIIIAGTLANINPAHSLETTLAVSPRIVHSDPGQPFDVNITVTSVNYLYDWQVNLTFNPEVLGINEITEGDFLARQPEGTAPLKRIESSWALFGWTTQGSHVGESGSGVLATVKFDVLAAGESLIKFDMSRNTTYLEAQTSPNPPANFEEIEFTTQDGVFTNTLNPPTADFSFSPDPAAINQVITFNASASSATSPLEIVNYIWDFDDGTNATVSTAITNHTYTAGGVYEVSLTVVDDAVASDLINSVFGTTGMPRVWYDTYSTKVLTVSIALAHDVAVTNVATSKNEVTAGEAVTITVTAKNRGAETEDFSVTAYYASNEISTQQVIALGTGEEQVLTFNWDTSGVAEGNYQIKASASMVEGDGNAANNVFVDGTVKVNPAAQFPTTLVVGAVAVVVLVLALVIVVFLRRRKP